MGNPVSSTDERQSGAPMHIESIRCAFGALFPVVLLRVDTQQPTAMLKTIKGLSRHKRPPPHDRRESVNHDYKPPHQRRSRVPSIYSTVPLTAFARDGIW
jgi:hypothetical protein